MPIADLHHVSINVDNLAVALPFYTEVLGLAMLPRPELGIAGAWLAAGGVKVSAVFETEVSRQIAFHDPCGNRIELNEPKNQA
jgi:predicted enzyme related to lactoylglutathione lyase